MRDKLAGILITIGKLITGEGIVYTIKDNPELEEARLREKCRIWHEGRWFQKIILHIANSGNHVCYRK